MEQYLKKVKQMIGKFKSVDVVQIPRGENYRADILAKMAAVTDPNMPKSVLLEVKSCPSIEQNLEVMRIDWKSSWMDPIVSYIRYRVLPADKLLAWRISS